MAIMFVALAAPIVASTVVTAALVRMARTPPRTPPTRRTQTPTTTETSQATPTPLRASASPRSLDAGARHHAATTAAHSSETAA
jgi:hypothetical protein